MVSLVECCFNLHFSDDTWYGALSYMLVCHLYVCFNELSVNDFGPIFD